MSSDSEKQEEVRRMRRFVNEYNDHIVAILRPAVHLIEFAEKEFPKERSSRIRDDMLRAAVVFLHATLEDFLRYIGCADPVAAHRDKRTFGNTERISKVLKRAGIPIGAVEKFYPSLEKLMDRRHQIVHKGDLKQPLKREGERDPEPIDLSQVKEWQDTVLNFVSAVAASKMGKGV
jgi:hypothetical protein